VQGTKQARQRSNRFTDAELLVTLQSIQQAITLQMTSMFEKLSNKMADSTTSIDNEKKHQAPDASSPVKQSDAKRQDIKSTPPQQKSSGYGCHITPKPISQRRSRSCNQPPIDTFFTRLNPIKSTTQNPYKTSQLPIQPPPALPTTTKQSPVPATIYSLYNSLQDNPPVIQHTPDASPSTNTATIGVPSHPTPTLKNHPLSPISIKSRSVPSPIFPAPYTSLRQFTGLEAPVPRLC
jgi:hypothetical protein